MRVIGYGSRSLTKAEYKNFLHSGKLEFLALAWATCGHFRDYLYHASDFIVYADNNPLTYNTFQNLGGYSKVNKNRLSVLNP